MRPVNLIPADERRGESAPSRTGALSYVLVGALAVVLLAVTSVVLTNKGISDKEAEIASLERKEQELQARAQNLAAFVNFKQAQEARTETISSLAQTRFDWERVLRELSRVLPARAWLVNLTGTVSPEVSLEDGANISLRGTIPGPALQMIGCARSQAVVARLISAVGDIDGVTRVAAERSEKPTDEVTQAEAADDIAEDCRTRNFLTRFELVAAFDSVPAPDAAAPPATPAPPAPSDEGNAAPASDQAPDGGVGEQQAARNSEREGAAKAEADARQAANVVPGGNG